MLAHVALLAGITLLAALAAGLLLTRLAPRIANGRYAILVSYACRLALAAVFLAAAYGKLRDPYGFAVSIYAYRVIPADWAAPAALAMPAIETLASFALLTGLLWRGGSAILGGLLLVFIAALGQAILRGIDIDCGCFGKGSSPVSFWLIARNYLLLLCALLALALSPPGRRR